MQSMNNMEFDAEFDFEKQVVDNVIFGIIEKVEEKYYDTIMIDSILQHFKESSQNTRTIYHDCKTVQLDKRQDFSQKGKGKDTFGDKGEFDYIVVMDGHGDPRYFKKCFSDIVDIMDFSTLLATENPVNSIVDFIDLHSRLSMKVVGINAFLQVGSTLSIAKIYNNPDKIKVVCYSVGDSRIAIYKNGSQVYINEPHTIMTLREHDRLRSKLIDGSATIVDGHNFKLINSNTITRCENNRVLFTYGNYLDTNLVPTQCLGHLGVTGIDPEIYTAEFDASDNIRVIVYSDGVDDMICDELIEDTEFMVSHICDEIIDKSVKKWNSPWIVVTAAADTGAQKDVVTTTFGKGDDCSVGIWDNYYYDCLL
jgi:serine/threonine protein phosphatase PrpC